jgi:superfamily II DNA or RNA helicase/HKD family nuclease
VPRSIPNGVYEHPVTEELEEAIAALDPNRRSSTRPVTAETAPTILARHLAREIQRVLGALRKEGRTEAARLLVSALLEHLAALAGDQGVEAESICAQRLSSPVRELLSIDRGATPDRPASPLAQSTLLTRSRHDPALGHELAREIATADRIDAVLAFVTVGGVRSVRESLEGLARRSEGGGRMRLLTTSFTGTTEIEALDMLGRLPGVRIKVSHDVQRTRLHAKAWLFHRDTGLSTAYIGSANFTATALTSGHEWTVKVCAADLPHVIDRFEGTFNTLWNDPEFEDFDPKDEESRARLQAALRVTQTADPAASSLSLIGLHPYPFQEDILDRLAAERSLHGRRRNLVVAATGTGKTVVAAFDYSRVCDASGLRPRLLFLAHRREILVQARDTFRHVLHDASFGEILSGTDEPERFEHLFATIQSVAGGDLVDRFGEDHWRHVVVDECHHVPASSYQKVVPRLRPDLLVGLTATPERSDEKSLLPDFDGHIAAELRLWHALERQLLVPFEYYGVSDGVDLSKVRWSRKGYDVTELAGIYSGHEARAQLVLHQLGRRVRDVRSVRALGFCVSVEHARFMAAQFTAAGVPALDLHGDSPDKEREAAPGQLRSRDVNVLFTCDLYNEGVDLPFVDTLLLLRPTMSATLFLQQLGRGLRMHKGKSTCLVLDFIGQHREEFRFDGILSALTGLPRGKIRSAVDEGFPYLPSGCALQLDAVARETILRSLRSSLAGGSKRLAQELRQVASTTAGGRVSLRLFLEESGRELEEVYNRTDFGWTTIRKMAGLLPSGHGDDETDETSRRLGWLTHSDEPQRLRAYRDLLTAASRGEAIEPAPRDRVRMHMLEFQLNDRGVLRAAEETARHLAARPGFVEEFEELREVLEDRVGLASDIYPVPEWPLGLHRHYSRREIVAAVGYMVPGKKGSVPQGGILAVPGQKRELRFVTLDKSGKDFSPSTRYRDFAISRDRFHWETQGAASVTSPSGRRYVDSPGNGWTFHLFVRPSPDDAYAFLGPVVYESHTGDRPIAITWKVTYPMAAPLFEEYATLAGG